MKTFINKNEIPKKLSILICSMGKRTKLLDRLMQCLRPQLTSEVEVIIDTDDGELTIGAKRNGLVESATGEYCAFIDDDDLVSNDYISKILTATESKPDTCAFESIITVDGKEPKPVYISMKYEKWVDTETAYYRSTQHLSPIKTEIAKKVKYPDTSMCEDRVYSEGIQKLMKTEVEIKDPIYFYDYLPSKSWFKVLRPTDVFSHIEIMCNEVYADLPKFKNTLVGLGPQFLPTLKEVYTKYPNLKPIAYQFEQLWSGSRHVNNQLGDWVNHAYDVWDYDLDNIAFTANTFGRSPKFRPLVYAEGLKKITTVDNPEIDVLFYGTTNDRRTHIMSMIRSQNPGKNIAWSNAWGDKLDVLIGKSKVILNLHYYETCLQEQARMFYPLINGKCIVSEPSKVNYYGEMINEVPTEHLGRYIAWILDKNRWKSMSSTTSNDFKSWSSDVMKRMILD